MIPGQCPNGDVKNELDPAASGCVLNMIPGQFHTGDVRNEPDPAAVG